MVKSCMVTGGLRARSSTPVLPYHELEFQGRFCEAFSPFYQREVFGCVCVTCCAWVRIFACACTCMSLYALMHCFTLYLTHRQRPSQHLPVVRISHSPPPRSSGMWMSELLQGGSEFSAPPPRKYHTRAFNYGLFTCVACCIPSGIVRVMTDR